MAEQGDATAQYTLGVYYAYGRGITQDRRKAVEWFQRAADQGLAQVQSALEQLNAWNGSKPKI